MRILNEQTSLEYCTYKINSNVKCFKTRNVFSFFKARDSFPLQFFWKSIPGLFIEVHHSPRQCRISNKALTCKQTQNYLWLTKRVWQKVEFLCLLRRFALCFGLEIHIKENDCNICSINALPLCYWLFGNRV